MKPCALAFFLAGKCCLLTAFQGMGAQDSKGSPGWAPQGTSFEPESWGLLTRSLPCRLPALFFAPQTKRPARNPAHIEAGSGVCDG